MANRQANQLQIRVVQDAAYPVVPTQRIRGTANNPFATGQLLTLVRGGRAATLGNTIDSQLAGPVKYIALAAFGGGANEAVAVQEIKESTRFDGQISTGTASFEDIGKQGRLIRDAATGHYSVNLAATAHPAIEVTDVESNHSPYGRNATGTNNLVRFKFLPAVINKAPASAG